MSRPNSDTGRGLVRGGTIAGVVGLVGMVIGFATVPRQAYISYLTAYAAVLTTVLGALIMVMISHATGAKWFVVLRRLTETVAATLPLLAVLFVPIVLGMHWLYPWTTPAALPAHARELVEQKRAYLDVRFFIVRAGLYFAVWIVIGELLRRWSVRQDREPDLGLTLRQRRWSAGGLPFVALALTFASFDWLMSLTPTWYSTIYGVYAFAGGFVAALALVAVVARFLEAEGTLGERVTPAHDHALGNLLLTFVIFWAYIAFSQFLIIWIADVPEESAWYATRMHDGWGAIGVALAIGHFAIPFVLLLFRRVKRSAVTLAGLGFWLLGMHALDVYWLVSPTLHPGAVVVHPLDFAAFAMVIGFTAAFGAARLRRAAPVPVGDPYLAASLRYRGEAAT